MLGPVTPNLVTEVSSSFVTSVPNISILQKIPRIISCWAVRGASKCCILLDTTKEDSFSDISEVSQRGLACCGYYKVLKELP
jgi:hypothetical protein